MSRNDDRHNKQAAGNREAWYDSTPADDNQDRDEQGVWVQVGAERVDELAAVGVWAVEAADDVAEVLASLAVVADVSVAVMGVAVEVADVAVEAKGDVAAVQGAAVAAVAKGGFVH